jgi:uncharacterized coiled-coil protein SlyX
MTDNVNSIIIEHLKALRNELREFRTETRDNFEQVKARVQSLEERATLTERGLANVHGDIALVQLRLDKLDSKIDRIERRLELTPV